MNRKASLFILAIVFSTFVVAIALRFSPYWKQILPAGPIEEINFSILQPPSSKDNWYLVCPKGYCSKAEPNRQSPIYPVSEQTLRTALLKMIDGMKNVTVQQRTATALELVVRTPLIGWPDRVSIQILPSGGNNSTLLIYSRSYYGASDFGANRRRIEAWLNELDSVLQSSGVNNSN